MQSTGCRHVGSIVAAHRVLSPVVLAHGLSYSMAGGIFLHKELNWCPLLCKTDLNHWTTREALFVDFLMLVPF